MGGRRTWEKIIHRTGSPEWMAGANQVACPCSQSLSRVVCRDNDIFIVSFNLLTDNDRLYISQLKQIIRQCGQD